VRIWHHGGIFVNAESIGDDVHLRHNVAIGITRRGLSDGLPIIEDRVDIYTGVCIAGPVRVGHGAVIGANTVVTADVAAESTVIGNPARRIPGTGNPGPPPPP
jgi:serine O-acetyltransferase